MAVFTYSRVPAFNPNTSPVSVAKSATGSLYDLGDTGFLTPLNLTLVATNTVTSTLVSDANGMFPDFTLVDRTSCVFKSGTNVFVLTTTTPIAGPTGPASTVPGPPGPATTDASLLTAGTVADARLPVRLSVAELFATYAGHVAGVAVWAASTVYTAGQMVRNPSGQPVTVVTAHTSTATYDATKFSTPLGYMPLAGTPTLMTIKPTGDARPGVWEFVHNDTAGYIFHLMSGAGMGAGQALIGMGIDNGGVGLFVNNKKTGLGIKIDQNNTITSVTAFGMQINQMSTVAPAVQVQTVAGATTAIQWFASSANAGQVFLSLVAAGEVKGEVKADTGRISWKADIQTRDGGMFRAIGNSVAAEDSQVKIKTGETQYSTWTGSTNQYWHKRISHGGQSLNFELADTLAGGVDAAPVYTKALELKNVSGANQVGLYGVTPVARAAAIATPTAPSATYVQAEAQAMKTAVDAIRVALTGIGITA